MAVHEKDVAVAGSGKKVTRGRPEHLDTGSLCIRPLCQKILAKKHTIISKPSVSV